MRSLIVASIDESIALIVSVINGDDLFAVVQPDLEVANETE